MKILKPVLVLAAIVVSSVTTAAVVSHTGTSQAQTSQAQTSQAQTGQAQTGQAQTSQAQPHPVSHTVSRTVSTPVLYGRCAIGGTDYGDNAQTDWGITLTNPASSPQWAQSYTVVFYAGSRELNSTVESIDTVIAPGQTMTFPQDPFYKDGATSCQLLTA